MSAFIISDITKHKPQIDVRCQDLIVDGNTTLGNPLPIADIQPGAPGQVLITNLFGNVAWAPVPPIVIVPGPPNSVYQTDPTGTTTQWNTNLMVPGTGNIGGALTVSSSTSTVSLTSTNAITSLNGNIVCNMGDINALNGNINCVMGDFIASGGNVVANSGIVQGGFIQSIGGLHIATTSQLDGAVNFLDAIQIAGNPGVNGQVLSNVAGLPAWGGISTSGLTPGPDRTYLKTVGVTPTWVTVPTISNLSAIAIFPDAVNYNAGALTVVMVFPAGNVTINTNTFQGDLPPTPITYNAALGQFTVPYTGMYELFTNASFFGFNIGVNAQIRFTARINGATDVGSAYSAYTVAGIVGISNYSGSYKTMAVLTAGDIVTFTYGRSGPNVVDACSSTFTRCGIRFVNSVI